MMMLAGLIPSFCLASSEWLIQKDTAWDFTSYDLETHEGFRIQFGPGRVCQRAFGHNTFECHPNFEWQKVNSTCRQQIRQAGCAHLKGMRYAGPQGRYPTCKAVRGICDYMGLRGAYTLFIVQACSAFAAAIFLFLCSTELLFKSKLSFFPRDPTKKQQAKAEKKWQKYRVKRLAVYVIISRFLGAISAFASIPAVVLLNVGRYRLDQGVDDNKDILSHNDLYEGMCFSAQYFGIVCSFLTFFVTHLHSTTFRKIPRDELFRLQLKAESQGKSPDEIVKNEMFRTHKFASVVLIQSKFRARLASIRASRKKEEQSALQQVRSEPRKKKRNKPALQQGLDKLKNARDTKSKHSKESCSRPTNPTSANAKKKGAGAIKQGSKVTPKQKTQQQQSKKIAIITRKSNNVSGRGSPRANSRVGRQFSPELSSESEFSETEDDEEELTADDEDDDYYQNPEQSDSDEYEEMSAGSDKE